MKYIEMELDIEARNYLLSHLRNGSIAIAKELAIQMESRSGAIKALLPSTTSPEKVNMLEDGGVACYEKAIVALHALVRNYVERAPDCIVMINHSLARPDDPLMDRSPWSLLTNGSEVYYNITKTVSDIGSFRDVLLECHSAIGFLDVIGIITHESCNCVGSFEPRLVESDLDRLAQQTELAFFGAYDGESYLIWRPANPPFFATS